MTARLLDMLDRIVTYLGRSPPTAKWGLLDAVGLGMMFWFTTNLPQRIYPTTEWQPILVVLASLVGLRLYNSIISMWFARRGCVGLIRLNAGILPVIAIVAGSILIVLNTGAFILAHAQVMPDVLVLLSKDFGAGTITTFFVAVVLSRTFFPSRSRRSTLYNAAVHSYNWWLEGQQEQGFYTNWRRLAKR